MTCQCVREILPDLLDARAPAAAHPEARAHLASCPECQREFATLTKTAAALDTLPVPQHSAQLRENFYAMLEREKRSAESPVPETDSQRQQIVRRRTPWRWIVSPLLGCALIALGFVVGQRSVPAPAPTPPVVAKDDSTKLELIALREQSNEQRHQLNKMTTLVG